MPTRRSSHRSPLRVVGSFTPVATEDRVYTTEPSPERSMILEECVQQLERMPTDELIALLPVFAKHLGSIPSVVPVELEGA